MCQSRISNNCISTSNNFVLKHL